MELYEEFTAKRELGNKKIEEQDNLLFNRFMALDNRAYKEGQVPAKYKELMGLVGSMVLRCDDCISYHLGKSREAGCSKEEILEALNISLIIGGSILIPHLRRALMMLDSIVEKEQSAISQ